MPTHRCSKQYARMLVPMGWCGVRTTCWYWSKLRTWHVHTRAGQPWVPFNRTGACLYHYLMVLLHCRYCCWWSCCWWRCCCCCFCCWHFLLVLVVPICRCFVAARVFVVTDPTVLSSLLSGGTETKIARGREKAQGLFRYQSRSSLVFVDIRITLRNIYLFAFASIRDFFLFLFLLFLFPFFFVFFCFFLHWSSLFSLSTYLGCWHV